MPCQTEIYLYIFESKQAVLKEETEIYLPLKQLVYFQMRFKSSLELTARFGQFRRLPALTPEYFKFVATVVVI